MKMRGEHILALGHILDILTHDGGPDSSPMGLIAKQKTSSTPLRLCKFNLINLRLVCQASLGPKRVGQLKSVFAVVTALIGNVEKIKRIMSAGVSASVCV